MLAASHRITYNEVCIIIHQGLENIETSLSRPRSRPLFQEKDHFLCPQGASTLIPRFRDCISVIK